jgi:hypothetical protein
MDAKAIVLTLLGLGRTAEQLRAESKFARLRRRLRLPILVTGTLGVVTVIAIQTDPRVGPFLADSARKVVGPGPIATLEDWAYGMKDRVDSVRHGNDAPKTYWSDPTAVALATPAETGVPVATDGGTEAATSAVTLGSFPPPAYPAPFPRSATKSDGQWYPVQDDLDGGIVMVKSIVHPDATRPYAAVAVMAIDLERTHLQLVAGTDEPASATVKRDQRPGHVPVADHPRMIAAFNGGWQAVHGHFGMMVDNATLLPPRDQACTVAIYKSGALRIAPWTTLAGEADQLLAYRQTPPCLREGGSHNSLLADTSKNWGAAVDGATVIRRSALGLNQARNVMFYGVGDSLSALSIAAALGYAGASDVAELDVNWAFPRFLTYARASEGAAPTVKESLIPGTTFKPGEYVSVSWYRDFFYLTKNAP